jgi:hypothetical protein
VVAVAVAEGDALQNLYAAKDAGSNLDTMLLDAHLQSTLDQVGNSYLGWHKGDCMAQIGRLGDTTLVGYTVLGDEHLPKTDCEDIRGAEEALGFLYVFSLEDIRRYLHALEIYALPGGAFLYFFVLLRLPGDAFLYFYVLLSDHQKLRFHFLIHWTKICYRRCYRRCYPQVPVHTQRFFSSQIQMRYSALSLPVYRRQQLLLRKDCYAHFQIWT